MVKVETISTLKITSKCCSVACRVSQLMQESYATTCYLKKIKEEEKSKHRKTKLSEVGEDYHKFKNKRETTSISTPSCHLLLCVINWKLIFYSFNIHPL